MTLASLQPLPQIQKLSAFLPAENAVRLEIEEGIPIFRATATVQNRIETLLEKQQETSLTADEIEELDLFEEFDDYLSFVNRTVRNLLSSQPGQHNGQ